MRLFKKFVAVASIMLIFSGCVVNKQCKKTTLTEMTMTSELVDSFIKHEAARVYEDEIDEETRATLILSYEEYLKVYLSRYDLETYENVGNIYFDEFIHEITNQFVSAILSQDLTAIFQMNYVYQNVVIDTIYIETASKYIVETEEGIFFYEKGYFDTMTKLKVDFMTKWMSLAEEVE